MSLDFNSNIIEVRGTDYERGVQVGTLFRKAIRKAVKKFKHRMKDTKVIRLLENTTTNLKANFNYIYDELKGRADGAGIDYNLYLYFVAYEIEDSKTEHCTTILVNTKSNFILAHNEDGDYKKNDVQLVKTFLENGNTFYEVASMASMPTSTIRVADDFIYTTNYVGFDKYNFDYLPRYLFLRVLAECKTVEEFIATFKKVPLAAATHINLCDFKNKKLYSMEKALDKYSIIEVDGVYIHSNHLIHKDLIKYRPNFKRERGNTHSRQYVAEILLDNRTDLTMQKAIDILTYYNTNDWNSVFCKMNCGNDCLTMGTYVFDLNKKVNQFYVYNKNKDIVKF